VCQDGSTASIFVCASGVFKGVKDKLNLPENKFLCTEEILVHGDTFCIKEHDPSMHHKASA